MEEQSRDMQHLETKTQSPSQLLNVEVELIQMVEGLARWYKKFVIDD